MLTFQHLCFSESGDFLRDDFSPLHRYSGSHLYGHNFSPTRCGGAVFDEWLFDVSSDRSFAMQIK